MAPIRSSTRAPHAPPAEGAGQKILSVQGVAWGDTPADSSPPAPRARSRAFPRAWAGVRSAPVLLTPHDDRSRT
eukprot:scaffold1156_cov394-Prasinococcus_capsulatus_cf.AAC.4